MFSHVWIAHGKCYSEGETNSLGITSVTQDLRSLFLCLRIFARGGLHSVHTKTWLNYHFTPEVWIPIWSKVSRILNIRGFILQFWGSHTFQKLSDVNRMPLHKAKFNLLSDSNFLKGEGKPLSGAFNLDSFWEISVTWKHFIDNLMIDFYSTKDRNLRWKQCYEY